MVADPTTERERKLGQILAELLGHFSQAIEFWPPVCLNKQELGDPAHFIDREWTGLREQIQQLRIVLAEEDAPESTLVHEQIAKLAKDSTDLREVFDYFLNAERVSPSDLEAAVFKLAHLWHDSRMRLWLVGTLIPLQQPPSLSLEKEAYFQSILDRLFDQFVTTNHIGDIHERNGSL